MYRCYTILEILEYIKKAKVSPYHSSKFIYSTETSLFVSGNPVPEAVQETTDNRLIRYRPDVHFIT